MIRKRDGPASGRPTPGPGVDEHDARLLPRSESPRNSRAHPTTPKIRSRRRQGDPSWRTFRVRLVTKPGAEGATALYAYLRAAAKRFGLQVASVDEIDPE